MIEVRLNAILKCVAVSALAVALTSCSGGGSGGSTSTGPTLASVKGSYVFSVTGTDPTDGDYFALGSFVADGNGKITSGVADYNLGSGVDPTVPLTGTYTVAGGVATINLTDGKAVADTFTSTLATSGTSPIAAFDGNGSGTLYPQVTTGFTPVGAYSFTVKGEGQGTVTGSGNFVIGPGNTISAGNLAYTDGGVLMNYATASGFIDPPQSTGRAQAAIVGYNLAAYIVSPSQVLLIGLDERNLILLTATKQ